MSETDNNRKPEILAEAHVPPERPNPPAFEPGAPALTFKGSSTLNFKVVVPRAWVAFWRAEAAKEDATALLKSLNDLHPVNDDAFVEAFIKHGVRLNQRDTLSHLFRITGLGGTVSPAAVEMMAHIDGHDTPVGIQVLTKADDEQP